MDNYLISTENFEIEEFKETYEIEADTKLKVYNINGPIYINAWDKDYVEVHIIKKTKYTKDELKKVEIQITLDDDMIIKTEHLERKVRVSVNYEIRIPTNMLVVYIGNVNGKIKLDRTKGDTKLITTNGKIEVENVIGNINVETTNGKINIEDIKGDAILNTSNGAIYVENVEGYVGAETSNGKITIKNVMGILGAITSNGSIYAEIKDIKDDIKFETNNGSIELHIDENLNADIEVDGDSIDIDNIQMDIEKSSKHHIKGKLGNGGNKISAETTNGSIELNSL